MASSHLARSLLSIITVALVAGNPVEQDGFVEHANMHVRHKRQAVEDRPGCQSGASIPATRVDTTERLAAMRNLFSSVPGGPIHAYIVPSGDAHLSEYTSAYDGRRGYISGFTGSAGTAVITQDKAGLWTDGRYFLEAEDTLDCNWILMKDRLEGTPTISQWLEDELQTLDNPKVGVHPFLMGASSWKSYSDDLTKKGVSMVSVDNDLVDRIWTSGRPAQPNTPINELPMEYAGRTWQDKIGDVRAKVRASASSYIVTSLDETAWLFNLRAKDIAYNPFFISYAIVEMDRVRLYLLDHNTKLTQNPTDSASVKKLHEHLNTGMDGSCAGMSGLCVEVLPYSPGRIVSDVQALAASNSSNKIWISYVCNQAIYSAIPEDQRVHDKSAIALMKSIKNDVEQRGMKQSHIRDSVALITFMDKLEKGVKAGEYWTEMSAALELKRHREAQDLNRGLSFESIAGSGSNGAIIHYTASNATDKQITTSEMFLLDSGGQYLDGTTDVTRTFHFGTPTDYQKECYTRVLQGHIDLASLVWPKGLYGRQLDIMARSHLWKAGLNYRHGTGHGIGAYLSVHEGIFYIFYKYKPNKREDPLYEHMYLSDEPGYYEDGQFGIRLETIVSVERASTEYEFDGTEFLKFRPICLMPYEPHLIDFSMLTKAQKQWLVDYHKQVMDEVAPHLTVAGQNWARTRYNQFVMHQQGIKPTSGSANIGPCSALVAVLVSCLVPLSRNPDYPFPAFLKP